MTIQEQIRGYLDKSGLSERALSLQAGLNPRAVNDILNLPGIRSDRRTLDALGGVMGTRLQTPTGQITYAALIRNLSRRTGDETVDRRNQVLASRLKKFLAAAGWVAETEIVDRYEATRKISSWSPATLGISKTSFSTYKSDILHAISLHAGRNRPAGIRDVSGLHRRLHDALWDSDYPQDLKLISGTFLHFLYRSSVELDAITPEVLRAYHRHRLANGTKDEATCRKHVRRIATLCTRLASDPAFASFRLVPVRHPYSDSRNKYGVEAELFSDLLSEFDGPVVAWLRGAASRDGLCEDDYLAQLDAAEAQLPENPKKALLKRSGGRKRSDEERRSAGFLLPGETWSDRTISNRRYQLIAGAKALYAARGYQIESLSEFTEPDVVDNVLDALSSGNSDDEFPSSYAESVGKTLKKLARDYFDRSGEDITAIASCIRTHALGETGISQRNKARLREIIGYRQQRLIDLSDILIGEMNDVLSARQKRRPGRRRIDLLDVEQARDVMCAIASDILLARAPRRANVTGIRLSWISWSGDTARIVIPSTEVKGRESDDPDLHIPLDPHATARLKLFVEKIRPKALRTGDDDNPYLFPAQGTDARQGAPYVGLLDRLSKATKNLVGIKMNPHLYRHFLGWLWLREDPDRLPDVQRLLGHKRLETTLAHYAEIDEDLALERWSKYLAERKSRATQNSNNRRRNR